MENPYLIPIIVTLVTAMALGAIYLLVLLARDGQPEEVHDDTHDGDHAEDAALEAAADTEPAADAKH